MPGYRYYRLVGHPEHIKRYSGHEIRPYRAAASRQKRILLIISAVF
jgi:hypothetical protein